MFRPKTAILVLGLSLAPMAALGQTHDHSAAHAAHSAPEAAPLEPGQGAFAAIGEIVAILLADPETDWAEVNIAALREHLVDMNNVTLLAEVTTSDLPGGARFEVTGAPDVVASLHRMVPAHAAVMDGVGGWRLTALTDAAGAVLEVTGAEEDAAKIRALGFFGVMADGMHHQAHHLAMAVGKSPH